MIVEYLRYNLAPDRMDDFAAAWMAVSEVLHVEPSCRSYEVAHCVEDSERWIVRIEWESLQGHTEEFRGSARYKPFAEALAPFEDALEEANHYRTNVVEHGNAAS